MGCYILALDQGTSSSRALVFDAEGRVRGFAQREFRQIYPQPGWVEHDPEEIWETQRDAALQALRESRIAPGEIAAIGITNQRETTILWDRATGQPIHHAIVWQCRRTAPLCEALRAEGFDRVILERTGLVLDAYFSGTKIQWLLEHVPGARERARRGQLCFGTVDTWLIWKLTGGRVHATDPSNASRTMLYNIHARAWDEEILRRLDIPRELLPEVRASSEVYGETERAIFGIPIPIAGDAGDQQAALFGQACFHPGMAKNTYGTGCFVLLNTGTAPAPPRNGVLTTIAVGLRDGVRYALEGSVFIAGAAVQWLRDGLGIIRSTEEVEELARQVSSSEGVYIVPAFVGLGAPYWDMYARGMIIGITRSTTGAHLARATLEAIAFQVRDVIEAMEAASGITLEELRVDGGAARNDLLLQIQADVLGRPVVRPAITETTALGAAYLAGLAVGVWKNTDEIARQWQVERRFAPQVTTDAREALYRGWKRAVERARLWAEPEAG
ncbi:MAG: glycerol kinase GlpK [Blastocatellia bacterium]|nr:glycerol kinase GlpK [Blastocatellia bacterium]